MRPGLNPRRLTVLVEEAIARCRLDLTGLVVLTEAATGPYAVTPIVAARAGAEAVFALAKASSHGSVDQVVRETDELANLLGVKAGIHYIESKTRELVGKADIVTNSGHLRPIDRSTVSWMKPSAVISLMYEAWELRGGDVDLEACRAHGVLVGGVNERHPLIDVFSFLPYMAAKGLFDAGVAVYGSQILILCDNPFAPYLVRGLTAFGATVTLRESLRDGNPATRYDAILVALQPQEGDIVTKADVGVVAEHWPGATIVQYWGDLDREACRVFDVPVWPHTAPRRGHMAILPSDLGPEPVVRLQTGGLKVGEVLAKRQFRDGSDAEYIELV